MESIDGKVAVVTGAASGLGFAMASRFASGGAKVVLADVAAPQLERAASELAAGGAEVLAVPTDVTQPAAVDELARRAFDHFGRVHVVCNNAGLVVGGPTWEIELADWHRLLDVNLWGVVHGVHAFVPRLLEQGEPAHVVNTASMAGVMTLASLAPYVASKHAVVGLSEVLARDLAAVEAPIGVSVVCPGFVPTRLGREDRDAPVPPPAPGRVSADDVAARVHEAILEDRFYVFTHPRSLDYVSARHAAMLDGHAPASIERPGAAEEG
jgi:NAD(P)-dependent dehydrogenase (short-subunit alcohol dehydrogenase family)